MQDLGEIVGEFLMESHEYLDRMDRDLVALEREPQSREPISRIFRTIHRIKGTSGFLAFTRLETLAHAGESLLSRLRDGVQPVTPATITTLRATVDGVRSLLTEIERSGTEGAVDVQPLIVAVHAHMTAEATAEQADADPVGAPQAGAEPVGAEPVGAGPASAEPLGAEQAVAEPAEEPEPLVERPARPAPEPVRGQRRPLGEILVQTGATSSSDVASALQQQLDGDERKLGTILLDEGKAAPAAVIDALRAQAPPGRSVPDSAIRVDVDLLDGLMNLVGELVLARNQLIRGALETGDTALVRIAQRVGAITGELQQGVMKTRMQPIGHIWSKLPRVVRDLSTDLGKQVELVVHGTETELDRSVLDALEDPVTHLVRNAVDHGIEEPERRVAAGKPAEGTVTLRAYHEDGHVTVEVADDGAGPDADVDMDVVKTDIERVGGTVTVDSTPGEGTVWRLTIPLTLAIIQALTVDCGDQRYVVPQASVLELVFIDGQATRIEYAGGAPVYRLRGKVLPLVRLDRALGLEAGGDRGVYVMVLQADGRRFGLVVDRVLSTEEVVVKAYTRSTDMGRYAGATILGDGKVGLILDVPSLARRSHVAVDSGRANVPGASRPAGPTVPAERLLIAAVGERRVAIPLDTATRLEEFPRDRVEHAGPREIVRYRGRILPLVRLSHLLGSDAEVEERDTVSAVVYSEGGSSVALVVDRIVDIAESIAAPRDVEEEGLVGTAVIQQRVTELLDVRRAIRAADPNFYRDNHDEMLVEA